MLGIIGVVVEKEERVHRSIFELFVSILNRIIGLKFLSEFKH
jgi:hypothetical protein